MNASQLRSLHKIYLLGTYCRAGLHAGVFYTFDSANVACDAICALPNCDLLTADVTA